MTSQIKSRPHLEGGKFGGKPFFVIFFKQKNEALTPPPTPPPLPAVFVSFTPAAPRRLRSYTLSDEDDA